MAQVAIYNREGKKTGELTVSDAVFAVKGKPEVVHFVANAQRANASIPYADTKTRGEVRGGGRKPRPQKGTGQSRQGSIRAPQWKGGGVIFGPTSNRNMSKKINQKTRRKAICMVLSDKLRHETLVVIDSFDGMSGKTKELSQTLHALPVNGASALVASGAKNEALQRAARNLKKVNTTLADSVNVLDLLKYRYVVVDTAGIEKIVAQFQ